MLGSDEMAVVKPFRALRYDERKAGPLDCLVAPPYDVISADERGEYLARSPYNVVHLTLPESEAEAARDLSDWQREGILVRDDEPALWALSQRYVGPDGVERTRSGKQVLREENGDSLAVGRPAGRRDQTLDVRELARRAASHRRHVELELVLLFAV